MLGVQAMRRPATRAPRARALRGLRLAVIACLALGKLVTEGMARVGALVFQGHLDALFYKELAEVQDRVRPDSSEVRARTRHLAARGRVLRLAPSPA